MGCRKIAIASLCALLAATPGARAAQQTKLVPGVTLVAVESLKEWDDLEAAVTRYVWQFHDYDALLGPDGSGRTMGQYADDWIMAPDTQKDLKALKEEASSKEAAGDHVAVAKILGQANRIFALLEYRCHVLVHYVMARRQMRAHLELIDALVAELPVQDQVSARATIRDREPALRQLVLGALETSDPDRFAGALQKMRAGIAEATDDLNTARTGIAARVPVAKGRDRQSPCPAPAAQTSQTDRPVMLVENLTQPDYPPSSRRMGYSGHVVIRFVVSETGCVTRTELLRSVGVDELDDAALVWGEAVQFLPAVRDGKAVASTSDFTVTFKLTD